MLMMFATENNNIYFLWINKTVWSTLASSGWKSLAQQWIAFTVFSRPEPNMLFFLCWLFYSAILIIFPYYSSKYAYYSFNIYHHSNKFYIQTITTKFNNGNDKSNFNHKKNNANDESLIELQWPMNCSII